MIHLTVRYEDTLAVVRGEHVLGEVAPSCDGWAAYKVTQHGRLVTPRIGTYPNIERAVAALKES